MKRINLASNLLILRTKKLLSQEKMAKEIGVNRTTITNYEAGISAPDYEKLFKIAKLFDISMDDLLLADLSKGKAHTRKEHKELKEPDPGYGSPPETDKKIMELQQKVITLLEQVTDLKDKLRVAQQAHASDSNARNVG